MNKSKYKQHNQGQALMVTVIFFMFVSLATVAGTVGPVVRTSHNASQLQSSNNNYFTTETGVEDVLYRLINGKTVSATETLNLNGAQAVTTTTDVIDGKMVNSVGSLNSAVRKVEAHLATSEGVAFNYAMQAGSGGFFISGGSTINGNVYANGNVIGDSGTITGSATAANSSPLVADQTNDSPSLPPNDLVFGNASATQDFAQSFQVTSTAPLNKISVYLKRTSLTPGNLTARLVADASSMPGNSTLDSTTITASAVPTTYDWIDIPFTNYLQLEAGTTYWLVLDGGNNSSKYYTLGANATYANGVSKLGSFGGSWNNPSPANLDGYFKIYTGGIVSQIAGQDGSWDLNVGGDSWANTVNKTATAGTLYCQNGTGNANGKVCNTSRPDPAPAGFAITDSQLEVWRLAISDGIVGGWTNSGNLTIGWQGTSTVQTVQVNGNLTVNGGGIADMGPLEVNGNVTISGGARLKAGPIKIDGNLVVGSNGLTVKGNIWVTGTISVSSGAAVSLDPSYGASSALLIADGPVNLSGGGVFSGSGTTGSYPLLITSSRCPADASCGGQNAIAQSGGSGAVVLAAPYGTLSASGGTSARAMTAYKIMVSGGGTVTYDSGLADISLSSGPSGGFQITGWGEVE